MLLTFVVVVGSWLNTGLRVCNDASSALFPFRLATITPPTIPEIELRNLQDLIGDVYYAKLHALESQNADVFELNHLLTISERQLEDMTNAVQFADIAHRYVVILVS